MALTSPIGGYPYPALSDPPNAQTFGQNLTSALDLTTLPQFASASAVATAIPSPTNGQRICRTDVGLGGTVYQYSTGSSRWIAGYNLIAETIAANATTSSFTFSGIPQDFTHLRLLISGRCATSSQSHKYAVETGIQLNGDTTQTDYGFTGIAALDTVGSGGTPVTYGQSTLTATGGVPVPSGTAPTGLQYGTHVGFSGDPGARIGFLPGESLPSVSGIIEVIIPYYSSGTGSFVASGKSSFWGVNNAGTSYTFYGEHRGGWTTSAAVTSITIGLFTGAKFNTGCAFRLYGF